MECAQTLPSGDPVPRFVSSVDSTNFEKIVHGTCIVDRIYVVVYFYNILFCFYFIFHSVFL